MGSVGGEALADDQVDRQLDARAPGAVRLRERAAGVLGVGLAAERLADGVPLRAQEREAHRAADDDRLGDLQEALDHADLVLDLRAADDRDERLSGALEDARQRPHLAFEQAARRARQQVRDALGARVRAMGGAEGIVDVGLRQLREGARELGVVALLAGLEAHVLEQQDLALGKLLAERAHACPDDRGRELHRRSRELAQELRHGRHRQRGIDLAAGTPEMRDEHEPSSACAQLLDRAERRSHARVVRHHAPPVRAVCERHVEVDTHEHAPAVHVQLVDAPQRLAPLCSRSVTISRRAAVDRARRPPAASLTGSSAPGPPGDWSSPTRCRTRRRP